MTNFEKNLISFLRLFQNRPIHLSKYLIENNAFSESFIEKVSNSRKLNELSSDESQRDMPSIYFSNFKDMLKFFDNISNEFSFVDDETSVIELNQKLDDLIKREKYEEAIMIRDYMKQNNIKRNN